MSTQRKTPNAAQRKAEKTLRDMGATVTFTPAAGVPHNHRERVDGCFRCEMVESIARVNKAEATR